MSNTTTQAIRTGATARLNTDDTANTRHVIEDTFDAYDLADDEVLINSFHGYITIGRLTGRTRNFWGVACPTIERYEIDTVVTDSTHRHGEGVIMGRKGARIAGTSAIRPEQVA